MVKNRDLLMRKYPKTPKPLFISSKWEIMYLYKVVSKILYIGGSNSWKKRVVNNETIRNIEKEKFDFC